MSENALTTSEKYVPVSNKLACPGIRPEPNRQASAPKKIITHLMRVFSELGSDFCATDCSFLASCINNHSWPPKKIHTPERAASFEINLNRVHKGMGFLSDDIINYLYELADGDCPVCSVVKALQQFPFIVHYADIPPLCCDAIPCSLELEYIDSINGDRYYSVTHIDALARLDLDSLPQLMPPDEDAQVRAVIAPGQKIITFLQNLQDGTGKIPPTVSDEDLWNILGWHPDDDDYSKKPSRTWIVWAKKKILHSGFNAHDDLLHIFDMAFSWYSNVRVRLNLHRDGFSLNDGIRGEELKTLFMSSQYLSQQFFIPGGDEFRQALNNAEKYDYFRSANWYDKFHLNGWYYSLTFIGNKEAEKFAGKAPCFFQEDEDIEWWDKGRLKVAPKTLRIESAKGGSEKIALSAQAAARSDSTSIASGGKGGDAKAIIANGKDAYHPETTVAPMIKTGQKIESGAVKVEANPTINVTSPDLAAMRAQDAEIERIRQEHETERTRIITAALTGKTETAPVPDKADPDGYTIQEYTDYVSGVYKPIDTGTARNILKDAGIKSIGKRTVSQGRPDVFPRQEAEKAAEEYVKKKRQA